ncbi:MAG TPA: hypothetical protein PKN61_06455 [Acidobacteriota bacterium]|jgi:L-lysine 2,3-aminomutase|nr:hypothetical protein [Acidobacteriota bacterium]HNU01095.1 hypothetical protein [Acidobacteriota bacterium]HPB27628.1 hypothetical protein [Acidobacteriota bacterium]HQO25222.1 hypothetical protein [Acidobacteriota bacterium]HQP73677.1 hypothetical protein [Acidobacteriota bacterium]
MSATLNPSEQPANLHTPDPEGNIRKSFIDSSDVIKMMERCGYPEDMVDIIDSENLLPLGLLNRIQGAYPQYSNLLETRPFLFNDKTQYSGLKGFRAITELLNRAGIDIGHIPERELFIEVYRFLATRHILNMINWNNFTDDSIFQLVFPQPGMIPHDVVKAYQNAKTAGERRDIAEAYKTRTNPHDGKQKLNKPWFENDHGEIEILKGGQHKYPQCQLIFDKTTQNCFTFCSYCFRHAQVRGDEDMFLQDDIRQVHDYMKRHREITDMLITGGDAGFIPYERFREYVLPILQDPELMHIRTVRLGSRALTFNPEMIISSGYNNMLSLFNQVYNGGVQILWMAHFSTPREVINPSTLAAIRRLKAHGVTVKSQSPIMNHISLFTDENGTVDVDRSAQNWIDLGNLLAMLSVGFHSMYCARPTGEHHYFTAPLADIDKVFSKIYRSLPSISRPSRYISMTSSSGKISLLGTTEINGEKVFVLKFNEARNMEWMDRVFLAKYDEKENTIEKLKPYGAEQYFYHDELIEIERQLHQALESRQKNKTN